MQPPPTPDRDQLNLPAVLHALGDPVRLELVRRAWNDPHLTCSAGGIDVPKSTLSNHWRILRESGLISVTADGRHRRIRLRAEDLDCRFPGLLPTVLQLTAEAPPAAADAHPST
ncbi:ArsR/SmtB family transcription factor [Nocardia sp. NPDC003482]